MQPLSGSALLTEFTIKAENFIDEDEKPLQYSFAVYTSFESLQADLDSGTTKNMT